MVRYGAVRKSPFGDDSPQFFKVFLPFTSSHQMSIPEAFIKNFKRIIPKKATLFDHSKKTWHVKLEQTDGRLFFKNGWQHFARDHSLEFGDFLVFRYFRNSRFDVKIFGKNGCEKEVAVDRTISSGPGYRPNKACSKRACIGKQKHLEISSGENEEACCSSKVDRCKSQRNVRINPEQRKISKDFHFVAPKNPYFVQTIVNHSKHVVSIPAAFIRNFKGVLPKKAILFDHSKKPWHVEVEQTDECLYFSNGWQDFATYHSLQCGDILVFRYHRNSKFEVKIFSKDGCRKEVAVDRVISHDQDSKAKRACIRSAHVDKQKHSEIGFIKNGEAVCSSKSSQHKLQDLKESKMPKDSHFVAPKNPYFVLAIKEYSKRYVYLPISVLRSLNIKLMPYIIIHTQNGNTWPVKVNFHNDGRMHFGLGWPVFINENNIEVGDQCVFEFVLGRENISKAVHVQILHGNARVEKPSQYRL